MEKKKPLVPRDQFRKFTKENNLKTAEAVQNVLKEMFADTLLEMLETKLDQNPGLRETR